MQVFGNWQILVAENMLQEISSASMRTSEIDPFKVMSRGIPARLTLIHLSSMQSF